MQLLIGFVLINHQGDRAEWIGRITKDSINVQCLEPNLISKFVFATHYEKERIARCGPKFGTNDSRPWEAFGIPVPCLEERWRVPPIHQIGPAAITGEMDGRKTVCHFVKPWARVENWVMRIIRSHQAFLWTD